jgi:murein DD-endopeptidase MepM/ murein hydrolase activator NlpD
VVVVDHGETRTTYEPVTASVSVGDSLPQGAVIGTLELVGSHCPPAACLHWGWLRGEEYLDPLGLVGAGPVRLLPLWRDEPVDPLVPQAAVAPLPWLTPYANVLLQLAELPRSPPDYADYARGCACW